MHYFYSGLQSQREAVKNIGVPRWQVMLHGTNEHELIRGIKNSGCVPHVVECNTGGIAKKQIDSFLSKGMSVIISTDDEQHWAVIAGRRGRNSYYWIDSIDKELIGRWKWKDIADWMRYDDNDYYMIGVEAQDMSGSIVKKFNSIYPFLKRKQRSSFIYTVISKMV